MPLQSLANLRLPENLSLAVLAQTLHCIPDAVSIADEDDILVYVNPAFTRMYGYTYDEAVGQPSSMMWADNSASHARAEIFPTTMQLESWSGELVNRRKDGSEFPIQLITSQVRNADGSLIALVGVAHDISERRQRQRQVEEQREQIQRANDQMRSELMAASKVQQVLLAPVENLERLFPEVMLLPIANSVLTGELYWTAQHLDRSFLALANPGSTGVRAALASALLYGLFNQIVNERMVTQPEAVLEELEERVTKLLDNDPERLMQLQPAVGFFSFAKNLRSARFAGVGVGLVLIRKGRVVKLESDPSMTAELKANRPKRAKEFVVYNLNLQFGDTLYGYTPGLLQQTDLARTAWTERELVAFLEGHQQLTMAEQGRSLSNHLERRRGGAVPTVDGLVMGIRF
jgi:PAS domain S-box-containing protein